MGLLVYRRIAPFDLVMDLAGGMSRSMYRKLENWILDRRVRSMIRFEEHDVVTQNPPGQYHLVFLRNSILTYNTDEVQRKVLEGIRDCLLPPGYLVIGRTESLPDGAGFEYVGRCIYRKIR